MCSNIPQFSGEEQCTVRNRSHVQHNEKEMRQLERIEEDHMRNILDVKTGIQVPLHLMYLDLGQVPARYQVKRSR